jgi:hypothetical protein
MFGRGCMVCKVDESKWMICVSRKMENLRKSLMHEMQSISWSQKIFQSKKKMLYISMTKITMIEMLKTMK